MSRQIIVADDHPLFREAMKAAVGRLDRSVGFVEADSVAAMLAAAEAKRNTPDATSPEDLDKRIDEARERFAREIR